MCEGVVGAEELPPDHPGDVSPTQDWRGHNNLPCLHIKGPSRRAQSAIQAAAGTFGHFDLLIDPGGSTAPNGWLLRRTEPGLSGALDVDYDLTLQGDESLQAAYLADEDGQPGRRLAPGSRGLRVTLSHKSRRHRRLTVGVPLPCPPTDAGAPSQRSVGTP